MTRRRTARKRSPLGRIVEIVADLALFVLILAFGISIAARFNPDKAAPAVTGDGSSSRSPGREAPPAAPQASSPAVSPPPAPAEVPRGALTVDIRNGCGQVGLAEDMMQRLRRAGFDVVEYRNADRYDYPKTRIRDLTGKPEAEALRQWLRREFGVGEMVRESMQSAPADVQLLLGADLADTLRRRERAGR